MIQVDNLSGGYDGKNIVKSVTFNVRKGEILGILGPNGSGKSTLLKLISGILTASTGTIEINGKSVKTYSPKAFARTVAVLPQLHAHAFSHSVRETVELGRYPHQSGLFSSWSREDERAVSEAMDRTVVTRYENQPIELLSGGEKQRVFVAQAIAQQAPILLLDEPTNHLDIAHQQQLLDMIRTEAIENGRTIISVFHDINLAALYCDRILLMSDGEIAKLGSPQEVVDEQLIEQVYMAQVKKQAHPERPTPQITQMPTVGENGTREIVTEDDFTMSKDHVVLRAKMPLKTVSSAVHNGGIGWYEQFVNRRVDEYYKAEDIQEEMAIYLQGEQFSLSKTVGMMTAAHTQNVAIRTMTTDFGTVIVAVTVGLGNALDIAEVHKGQDDDSIGRINTWVIVNGSLSDEVFFQAMVTATEAKVKALQVERVRDDVSRTIAIGTSTDSMLIAATQKGEKLPSGGPITRLGKSIAQGVFECTVQAIRTDYREKEERP